MSTKEKDKLGKSARRENIEAILVAIILALFIRTFGVQAFKIPSGSMKNTLLIGDQILVNKFAYGLKLPFLKQALIPMSPPKHGDIVVFKFPEDPDKDFIKRVIGLSGDEIEVRDKKVYVNRQLAEYPQAIYAESRIISAARGPRDNFGPILVPPHHLFVMGDNRDQSYDSRFWGFVDLDAVKGKAFMIYWSWDDTISGVRFNRLGDILK